MRREGLRSLWARAVLVVAMILFAAGIYGSSRRLEQAREASLRADNEAVWLAWQLEFEVQRLLLAAERYLAQRDHATREELALRLDVLWSRIPPVRQGEDGRMLRERTRVGPVIDGLERLLTHADAALAVVTPEPAAVRTFARQLEAFASPLRELVLDAITEAARRQSRVEAALASDLFTNRLSTLGLSAAFGLLVLLLWRETRRTRNALVRSQEEARNVRHLALHDPLTGLANRRQFEEVLNETLVSVRVHAERAALLLLDLDRFKSVNDSLGHAAGDKLLHTVATRLRGQLRREDFVARLGGDEFAVLQRRVSDARVAEALAQRLVAAITQPYTIEGSQVAVGVSVGIALAPDHGVQSEALMRAADAALYRAKSATGSFAMAQTTGGPETATPGLPSSPPSA